MQQEKWIEDTRETHTAVSMHKRGQEENSDERIAKTEEKD